MTGEEEGVSECIRLPSPPSLFIPAPSPLMRQLQTPLIPPHNERGAAISMGLSVVLALGK